MKKVYETPEVEKIAFQYRDQVVVASGTISGSCTYDYYGENAGVNSSCLGEWHSDHA